MPTQTEVESKLRRSLHSAAAAITVDADWDSFTDRLEEVDGTLPTLRPVVHRRRTVARRPGIVLVSAFAVVLVALGLVSFLSGPGTSTPAASPTANPLDDSLRYVPTFMPDYTPEVRGWFTNGDLVEEGTAEPQPTHVFVTWADESRAESGLVIWPPTDSSADEIGRERDDEGFWVQDFEEYPWLRIRGETPEGLFFMVDGTGDIDRDLVYEVARSIRDGQPLPQGVNSLADVTPTEDQYLSTPIERYWHLFAEGQGNHFDAIAHSAIATTEPIVQLAMFPWSCELIELDASTGALCDPGEWRLVWEATPDVVIGMSTVGFGRDDVIDIANSMELMSATDPRVPPPYATESE
jgi:hypothetical protein